MCSPLSSSVQATFAIYQHYCCRANQPDCLSPSADSLPILLYFKLARTHFKAGPLARSRGLSCNTKEFNLYAVQHGKHDSQLCLHWLPHSLSLSFAFSQTLVRQHEQRLNMWFKRQWWKGTKRPTRTMTATRGHSNSVCVCVDNNASVLCRISSNY